LRQTLQKNQDRFFGKLGRVEYYYYFAFFIIFTISCNQKGSVTLRMHQIRFSPGLCPGPRWRWGAHGAPPESLVGWERDTLSPFFFPSTPAAPHLKFGGLLQGLRRIDALE